MLDSKIQQNLVFKILPKTHGQLTFTGLEYRLTTPDVDNCEIIELKQDFAIRGPRLTKTAQHKKSVMYADDKRRGFYFYFQLHSNVFRHRIRYLLERLTVNIVEKCARLDVSLENSLPAKCLADEIISLTLIVKNRGNAKAKSVWLNHNLGDCIRIGDSESLSANGFTVEKSSLPGPTHIGDIESNEHQKINIQVIMSGSIGKRLLELIAYTESE